ncbi:MAG: hypothetical protein JO056_01655 [Alphaproteobacteria bacterium]|nr:hypothetical protein [Alphaproteobacteria bacterium]
MARYFKRLWVVALPFAVALLYSGILGKLFAGAADTEGPAWDASDPKTLNHAAAGIAVAATFSLLLIISASGAVFACVVALRRMGMGIFLAYAAIGIVTYTAALWVTFERSAPYIEDLGKSTYCATVGRYYEYTGAKNSGAEVSKTSHLDCKRTAWKNKKVSASVEASLAPLMRTIAWSAYASVLVLVSVALCCAGLSVLPAEPEVTYVPKTAGAPEEGSKLDANSRTSLNLSAQDLADRIRYLKYLAFLAAAVLGSGVAFLKSWAEWPLAFWQIPTGKKEGPPFIDAYQTIASALVNYEALFFVAIMLAVFGPFALILSRRGRHLARLDPELTDAPDKKNEWLVHQGLALTTADQIQRAIVFISPLLAAPIAQLFKGLVTLLNM